MIWTFILGVIAGWAAPSAEDRLRPLLEENLPGGPIGAAEMRAMSLSICLLLAALVATITDSGHVLPLALGAVLGVLGPRLYDRMRSGRAPDYDS